jgi:hypothetical protein
MCSQSGVEYARSNCKDKSPPGTSGKALYREVKQDGGSTRPAEPIGKVRLRQGRYRLHCPAGAVCAAGVKGRLRPRRGQKTIAIRTWDRSLRRRRRKYLWQI